MPTFRIPVFRDISQWKPEISQLLLFLITAIRRERGVRIYIGTMKQYLAIHFINVVSLHFNIFKKQI